MIIAVPFIFLFIWLFKDKYFQDNEHDNIDTAWADTQAMDK